MLSLTGCVNGGGILGSGWHVGVAFPSTHAPGTPLSPRRAWEGARGRCSASDGHLGAAMPSPSPHSLT